MRLHLVHRGEVCQLSPGPFEESFLQTSLLEPDAEQHNSLIQAVVQAECLERLIPPAGITNFGTQLKNSLFPSDIAAQNASPSYPNSAVRRIRSLWADYLQHHKRTPKLGMRNFKILRLCDECPEEAQCTKLDSSSHLTRISSQGRLDGVRYNKPTQRGIWNEIHKRVVRGHTVFRPRGGEEHCPNGKCYRQVAFRVSDGDGERNFDATFQQDGEKVTGKWMDADVQGTFADGKLNLEFPFNSEVGPGHGENQWSVSRGGTLGKLGVSGLRRHLQRHIQGQQDAIAAARSGSWCFTSSESEARLCRGGPHRRISAQCPGRCDERVGLTHRG